ncbi:hypothetical protein SAMN05216276_106034 [Streptosporangium subroseum]|uniref:Uncharacterized protein n=1 Tax=Streptosporangium subroseum TaxID=106412 RepID=A0A239NJ67_9ACTN|nr:hypothetical protein SAMN05216276_106034 [Streptosporangium subroseum]
MVDGSYRHIRIFGPFAATIVTVLAATAIKTILMFPGEALRKPRWRLLIPVTVRE